MKIFNYKLQIIHGYQEQKPRHVNSVIRMVFYGLPYPLFYLVPFHLQSMIDYYP